MDLKMKYKIQEILSMQLLFKGK